MASTAIKTVQGQSQHKQVSALDCVEVKIVLKELYQSEETALDPFVVQQTPTPLQKLLRRLLLD